LGYAITANTPSSPMTTNNSIKVKAL